MREYEWVKGLIPEEYLEFLSEVNAEYEEREARGEARKKEIIEAAREAEERGGRHWPL